MNDKISIIIPIYNVKNHLKEGIESLLNQTIGQENLEILMVDDCSNDGSQDIIDEYSNRYECCKAIHLKENSGSANKPRNVGIEAATGNYIMFLDSDDQFVKDSCETLYNAITKYDCDVAFARFRRIFSKDNVQKSYSPYPDDLVNAYPNETFKTANHLNVPDILWDNLLERFLFGKNLEITYKRDKILDNVYIDNIEQEPDLLKIPPAVWNKIYKKELFVKNNIRFQPFISGEDRAFTSDVFLNAEGIVFLNNYMCYNYFVRNETDDKSITHNVNVEFLGDLMDSLIYCRKQTEGHSINIKNVDINPDLLYWTNTWKNASFTKEENRLLLSKVNELKKIHKTDLRTKLLLNSISTAINLKIKIQRSE